MAGGISMGQALSLLGGIPVMPAGAMTIVEKLRVAKSMIPGDMGNILSMVMKDGPGALLQNPIGAVQGQLMGSLGGLTGQLSSALGGGAGGLISAITGTGGLGSALGNLGNVSNMLSGLTVPGAGQFGLLDAIGHTNIVGMMGSFLPPGLGVETIMGPLKMGDTLSSMSGSLNSVVNNVIGGSMSVDQGISAVTGMTGTINGVIGASNNAFSTVQGSALQLANASAAISMIASGPPALAPYMNMIVQDVHKPEIQAAIDEQIRV